MNSEFSWFRRPRTQRWGWIGLSLVVGFGAGNFHATREALAGQAQWLNDRCGRTVKARVEKHLNEDRAMFGFAPEDLKKYP